MPVLSRSLKYSLLDPFQRLFLPALAGEGVDHAREGPKVPLPEHAFVHIPDVLNGEERRWIDLIDSVRDAGDFRSVNE